MNYQTILITGGSGTLGKALMLSDLKKRNCLAPSHSELDITKKEDVARYFQNNAIDAVIHCAALTRMPECEKSPAAAIDVNILGTAYLVEEALKGSKTRFIYISTDYVYPCVQGPYSEHDATIPFTVYGWTKLGGECATKTVPNHCIVRTSFFDPDKITFDTAAFDAFCSKVSLSEIVRAIILLLDNEFVGTLNVGQERDSLYNILKKYKPTLKPVSLEEINRNLPLKRAADSSLDISLWKQLKADSKG